jgi:hypothetical protein
MRTRFIFLLTLLITATLSAQQTNELIIPRSAAPFVILPVAGNTPGANGTFFRSDINIINLRNAAQRVALYWLPQGQGGSSLPARIIDLNPLSGFSSENFVNDVLNREGIGGIEFVALTPQGAFDPNGLLHVTSRIWTPRPDGGAGTMSQTLPTVVGGDTTFSGLKAIFGLRRSTQYRLNVGVMNPAGTVQRFRITAHISSAGGTDTQVVEVDVSQRSIQQVTMPGTSSGTVQVLIENITGGAGGDWHGWASSVDNASGDAWSQLAFAEDD